MNKTNAMRRLDSAKIEYKLLEYIPDENDLSGLHIASEIGLSPSVVFKTIVAKGDKTGIVVFCIPSDKEIDLKAAAVLTGNKRVELIHVKDLLGLTGYIRGGCSPVGMKKSYSTFFDESVNMTEKITVSAGVRGSVLLLEGAKLVEYLGAKVGRLTY